MEKFLAEVFGTGALIVLGDGVVAGVLLARSKSQNAGWIVITMGWGLAVMVGVYVAGPISGAHLNPAVTLGLASIGSIQWSEVLWPYIAGEFVGAFLGACIVFLAYYPHWAITEDPGLKLAVFSTGPAVRNPIANLITEIIGTFMLLFGILAIGDGSVPTGLGALIVGLLIVSIGISLGGPTGYAINPARDLGPRIAHFVLPIPGKGGSDWEYSWIPVVGPIIGGVLGALVYQWVFTDYVLKIVK